MSYFKERHAEIDKYLTALTYLYGVVEHRQFIKVFNQYNKEKIIKDEVLCHAYMLTRKKDCPYDVFDNIIVSLLCRGNHLENIVQLQMGKPYYMPTREEIECLYKSKFLPSLEIDKLRKFLVQKLKLNLIRAEEVVSKAAYFAITEIGGAADFAQEVMFIAGDHLFELMSAYNEFSNNTRKWANRGNTPKELVAFFDKK